VIEGAVCISMWRGWGGYTITNVPSFSVRCNKSINQIIRPSANRAGMSVYYVDLFGNEMRSRNHMSPLLQTIGHGSLCSLKDCQDGGLETRCCALNTDGCHTRMFSLSTAVVVHSWEKELDIPVDARKWKNEGRRPGQVPLAIRCFTVHHSCIA